MKKFCLSLLCVMSLCAVCSGGSVQCKVTADKLNLRFAPELRSPVAVRIAKDTVLTIYAVKGNWVEVGAPENLKIYISEAFVSGGKVIRSVQMRSDKSAKSPSFGELPAGSEVKLIDDRAYGWVRIAPPENLHLYAARMYLDFKADDLTEAPAAAPEKAPEAAPAVPAADVAPATEAPAVPVAPAVQEEAK